MAFWGLEVKPKKAAKLAIERRLVIKQAALVIDKSSKEPCVLSKKRGAPAPPAKKAKEEPPAKKAKASAPPPAPAPAPTAGAPVNAWTKDEEAKFAKASAQFPDGTEGRWEKIAAAVGTRTKQQCKKKAKS